MKNKLLHSVTVGLLLIGLLVLIASLAVRASMFSHGDVFTSRSFASDFGNFDGNFIGFSKVFKGFESSQVVANSFTEFSHDYLASTFEQFPNSAGFHQFSKGKQFV